MISEGISIARLLAAFQEAGETAFDCWSNLELVKALRTNTTTPWETFFLLLSESDDELISEGHKLLLRESQKRNERLPDIIKSGYSKFIGFVSSNGGDKGLDVFFKNVKTSIESWLSSQTGDEIERKTYALIAAIQEFGQERYLPYKGRSVYFRVIDTTEGKDEDYLKFLCFVAKQYVNVLDAVLLENGVDLLEVQDKCNVQLLTEHNPFGLADILGGYNIANAFINALPARQSKPQQKAPEFPHELSTPKAKGLISKAVEAGFISVEAGRYKWNDTKVLLAYFAFKATAYLSLRTNANAVARWKPFEILFQVKDLRLSKAEYEKYHTVFTPQDSERIDALLEP